ncbi:MBL fold metallo-hydrolase [Ramlibacter sp. MAHUQ-53]|uniref:MBL fold metallo-hydrolase n=1 Tax=unclassified Ramlibacter TaxID=2617605 RepID=UPI00363ED2ED
MLRFKSLGSGSSGNATVVEATSGNVTTRLLVDCGLGIRRLDRALAEAGLAAADLDAIFVTHEHSDHIGCARALALRERLPVHMSAGTHAGLRERDFDGLLRVAADGQAIDLGALRVMPFDVPHDAREPLQLHCTDGDARLGILTDLGHVTAHVLAHLAGCGSLLLECNHDAQMLASGPYPWFLKRRVGGDWGHLANAAAAEAARTLQARGLRQVVAAHLSEKNNTPDLARTALAEALGAAPQDIHVATASAGCAWLRA